MSSRIAQIEAKDINRRRAIYMAAYGFDSIGEQGNRSWEYLRWIREQMKEAAHHPDSGVKETGNRSLREPVICDHGQFDGWLEQQTGFAVEGGGRCG